MKTKKCPHCKAVVDTDYATTCWSCKLPYKKSTKAREERKIREISCSLGIGTDNVSIDFVLLEDGKCARIQHTSFNEWLRWGSSAPPSIEVLDAFPTKRELVRKGFTSWRIKELEHASESTIEILKKRAPELKLSK